MYPKVAQFFRDLIFHKGFVIFGWLIEGERRVNTFPDRILIEARDATIQLEQLAVDDLDRNIDGYLQANWRARRMIEDWRKYIATNGETTNEQYVNFRAAYSETKGQTNKVFSNVLATHTRKQPIDLSQTMFSSYVAKPVGKEDAAVTLVNGEDGEDDTADAWARTINHAVRSLEVYGWWKSKVLIPPAIIKSLKAKLEKQMVKEYGDKVQAAVEGKEGAPLQIKIGSGSVASYEEMYEIAADPMLLTIVQNYMGVPPIFNTPVAFLNSFAKAKNTKALSDTAQLYHHDMHRLGFVKVFVYLTDVDLGSGPHTLVRGTHRNRPDHLWADGRHSDDAIADAGLAKDEVRVTGKAGTVFLVDTSCLHKGAHPDNAPRLMAQVQYTNSLFGKPVARSDHKIELAARQKQDDVQETAALVRKYATKSGVRFMQNFI
jgi:hypothetical protein